MVDLMDWQPTMPSATDSSPGIPFASVSLTLPIQESVTRHDSAIRYLLDRHNPIQAGTTGATEDSASAAIRKFMDTYASFVASRNARFESKQRFSSTSAAAAKSRKHVRFDLSGLSDSSTDSENRGMIDGVVDEVCKDSLYW